MNLKQTFQLAVMAIATVISTSCIYIEGTEANGPVITKQLEVPSFTGIEVASSANVELTTGDSLQVLFSEYENLIDYWDIKVVNNNLVIKTKPFTSMVFSKAKVIIVMPDSLESLMICGSGSISMFGAFKQLQAIGIYGSGNVNGKSYTHYSNIKTTISGSGNITLKGTAQELNAVTYGSGTLYARDLSAQQADCLISGSGDMHVRVNNLLKARIEGSGDIFYAGNPRIDIQVAGSGRLKHE
jgi:hypothetical protein